VRAVAHIMNADYRVDVVNMSYGEHSHWSDTGRVGQMLGEAVNKRGVVWVASAGNDGPALSTVGTPPDIATNTVIGVGAYVSPEMTSAMYSTRLVAFLSTYNNSRKMKANVSFLFLKGKVARNTLHLV